MATPLGHVTIARHDDWYEAFPDVCLLPDGRLVCVYRESDAHVASTSCVMLVESTNRGCTWTAPRRLTGLLTFAQDRAIWNCPRIARLPDGRLVVNCDMALYPAAATSARFPENQRCWQTFLWFSLDEGQTWSERQATEVEGLCPDRVLWLDKNHWLMAAPRFSTRFPDAYRISAAHSFDGGRTWPHHALLAEQPGFQHDEPSVVRLTDGQLLCVMRENVHTTRPSHYVLSQDQGQTWSTPRPTPFYEYRPAAGLLHSGRLLVTYRNVEPAPGETKLKLGRHPGTWAWLGNLAGLEGRDGGESRFLEVEHDGCGWHGDYGYSAWVQFEDGEIFCVYHHRDDAPASYIRGTWFHEEHFPA